jgi:hypothetical protein
MKTASRRSQAAIALPLLLVCAFAWSLPAETPAADGAADPTAVSMPPASFKIEAVREQPKFSIASPIMLGATLVCTLAGNILCLYSGSLKDDYDAAFNAWNANKTDALKTARDEAATKFFTPLGIGAGLNVAGIVFAIIGYDQGGGIKNLTPVPPAETDPSPSPAAP